MSLRAFLLSVALGVTILPTHAAAASSPCPDPGAVCNVQCYDSYCSIWRACWITETGIGVCSPVGTALTALSASEQAPSLGGGPIHGTQGREYASFGPTFETKDPLAQKSYTTKLRFLSPRVGAKRIALLS
jgi:hypothetical protein